MKNAILAIALLASSLLSISANTERVFSAEDGCKAPDFVAENEKGLTSLSELRGSYVIVNFWSAADAASRKAADEYNYMATNSNGKLKMVSVNFDRSESLFHEIVKLDRLESSMQYFADADLRKILDRDYGANRAMQSFLVDPQGFIVATNPSIETVNAML